jgi:molecular chaperone GrpE
MVISVDDAKGDDTERNRDIQGDKEIQVEGDDTDKGDKPPEKHAERMTKAELSKRTHELQEDSKKNYDLYLRSQAEIENLKKRNAKDKEEWIKYSNETLIKEILPVMDNLENALSHSRDENSLEALREGVALTLKGLKETLMKSGLEEVKAEGEPFDPCFHHAVSEQEDENTRAGTILHELQKGYILNQRLIRPAMVVVSKGKPGETTEQDKASEQS